MKARALKTFAGRHGMIRSGTVFNCEPGYFNALRKNKLVEEVKDGEEENRPGPTDDKSVPRAPGQKGKEVAGDRGEDTGKDSTPPAPAAGAAPPSSSSQAAPVSPEKTLTSSTIGGRRAARKKATMQKPAG